MNTLSLNTAAVIALALFSSSASAALVAHYTLDETEPATTVLDSSGLGNHATNSGMTFGAPGVDGTAIQNGSNNTDHVYGPDAADLGSGIQGSNSRTISLWFNMDADSTEAAVFSVGSGGGGNQFVMTVENLGTGRSINLRYGNGNVGYKNQTSNIELDTWYHVAFVYAGGAINTGLTAYVNGSLTGIEAGNLSNITQTLSTINTEIRIGNYVSTSFDGSIDDVQIYDSALNATEIQNIYSAVIPEPGSLVLVVLGGLGMGLTLMRRKK